MTYVIYAHLKMLAQVPIFTQMAATNVQIVGQREKSKEVRTFWMRMIDAGSAKQELLWGNVYLSDNETNALAGNDIWEKRDKWAIITAMRSTKILTKKVTHWMPLPEPPEVSDH